MSIIDNEYIMDDFDKELKLLYESTHDEEIKRAILIVQEYKIKYIDEQPRQTIHRPPTRHS